MPRCRNSRRRAEKEEPMRRRTLTKTLTRMHAGVAVIIVTLGALPPAAQAVPCGGIKRLQLRWSKKTGTALVSLSATLCDRPHNCSQSAAPAAGAMFTKSPITVTLQDAAGHSFSGAVDAGASNCAHCERVNRAGCLGGADTHRVGGTFVRYVVNTRGQTTVVANKLKLPATEPPNLVTPITLTITDAAGYAITAELHKCRTRANASGVALSCAG